MLVTANQCRTNISSSPFSLMLIQGPWSLVGATCHRIQPANPRRPKEYAILLASSATKNLIFPRRTQGLMRGSLSYRPLSSEWFVVIFFAWPTSTIGRTFSFPFHFFFARSVTFTIVCNCLRRHKELRNESFIGSSIVMFSLYWHAPLITRTLMDK